MKVVDLDVLRPEPRFVRLGGKDIDVSFVPCAITFKIDTIIRDLGSASSGDVAGDLDLARKVFELSIDLCVAFCEHKHPELDREWFYDNVDALQVRGFAEAVREALQRAYVGASGGSSKNVEAAETTSP